MKRVLGILVAWRSDMVKLGFMLVLTAICALVAWDVVVGDEA